jgi:serine/threonine-protein kinase
VDQAVKRLGPLPPDVALRITAQACLGLQKAHDAGVVHRDIKPANIYLTRLDGGEVIAKILDFGIAKVRVDPLAGTEGKSLTRTGTMMGSPLYMSPEQAVGAKTIDHRTDVWSLGVVLYEALTGTTPHASAETVGALILQICSQPAPPVQELAPWITPDVAALVQRALANDPEARWSSAREMYSAIRALLPTGHALHESMFVPLSAQEREARATRFSPPDDAPTKVASPRGRLALDAASGPVQTSTTAGVTGSIGIERTSGLPRSRSMVPILLGGIALTVVFGFGGWALFSQEHPTAAATGLVQSQILPPAPPPPALPPPTVVERAARLVVLPANARTEVDGVVVNAVNGTVPVVGSLGSTHHVRVSSADREKLADVVISEEGLVPAFVDLGTAPTPTAAPRRAAPTPSVAGDPAPKPSAEPRRTSLKMEIQ